MVGFPLLLIPLALYNIIVFLMPSVSFGDTLVQVPLVSGARWPVTLTDVLLALGILLLLLEVIKGARPGAKYLMDHLLSFIIFGAAAAEFVMWPRFGTSTYFLLVLLAMVDFLSGMALHVRRGRGTMALPLAPTTSVVTAAPPATVAHFEPAPAAASIAEPVLMDRPEPEEAHPAASAPSPEVPSPGLQPGNASPPSEAPGR